jgi:hypothetical protein
VLLCYDDGSHATICGVGKLLKYFLHFVYFTINFFPSSDVKPWHLTTFRKTTILVKKGEEKVINTIESWLNDGTNADEKQIDAWCDEGLVFRSTPLGVRAMHLAEVKEKKVFQTIRKPSMLKYALDLYVQAGTERYDAVLIFRVTHCLFKFCC